MVAWLKLKEARAILARRQLSVLKILLPDSQLVDALKAVIPQRVQAVASMVNDYGWSHSWTCTATVRAQNDALRSKCVDQLSRLRCQRRCTCSPM